jgi:hypothetical protein
MMRVSHDAVIGQAYRGYVYRVSCCGRDHRHYFEIHQLQAAVLTARHRSVMLGIGTYLCPPPRGEIKGISRNPDCGDDYRSGVAIWSEQVGGWQLLRLWQWSPVTIKNRRGTQVVRAPVAFNARGLANRNITWSTCVDERNLSLVLNRVGRPVTRAGWGRC